MKVAFDGKRYFKNHTGLGNYSRNLIKNISTYFPANEYHVLANNTASSSFTLPDNTILHDPRKKTGSLWRTRGIVNDINKINPNIYHGLSNELPLRSSSYKALKLVTIHDLFFHFYPKDFSYFDRTIYRKKTVQACKYADHIIAISNSTKKDIVEILGVNPNKISVVYQTCNEIFQKESTYHSYDPALNLPSEFALFVGSLNYRKNILGLIHALSILPKEDQIPLLIVGSGSKSFVTTLRQTIKDKNVSHLVRLMGAIPNVDLQILYKKARFTCLISFYEGFGIPIIESLFCNTPVLVADSSSLPEAAGNCGEVCDAHVISSISHGMLQLIKDDSQILDYQLNISSHIEQYSSFSTALSLNSVYKSSVFSNK